MKRYLVGLAFAALLPFTFVQPAAAAGVPLDCGKTAHPPGVILGSDGAGGCSDAQVLNHVLQTSGAGGGSGGAVTVADGADATLGAKADAKSTATDTTAISAMQVWKEISFQMQAVAASSATTATNSGSAIPAGSAIIGKVAIDQTTPGTTNGVSVTNVNINGSATSANSTPVVIASDQAAVAVKESSQYPSGATPLTASATGTTAATTATLAGTTSKTTYLCGFSIRANATAAATADSTVTGTITGTLHFTQWTAPAASGLGLTEEVFPTCIPASATNTGVAVVSAAPGTGGVVSVSAWGYQL